MQRETKTIPVVFNFVIDPIGAGFVASFPRPGGNVTGIVVYEAAVVGKWMEMLKEIAPQTARVALLRNPKAAPTTTTCYKLLKPACAVRRPARSDSRFECCGPPTIRAFQVPAGISSCPDR